ncbi:MAG: dienelactone hydrolase family protein [Acidimicrobiia bacterium]
MVKIRAISGLAYYVGPPTPANPVLLLHSWHGLNGATKKLADRLADQACTVIVPDLLVGTPPATQLEAEEALGAADPNQLASATLGGLEVLGKSAPGPAMVLGLGKGGSMALWVSVRRPQLVNAVVSSMAHRQSTSRDQVPATSYTSPAKIRGSAQTTPRRWASMGLDGPRGRNFPIPRNPPRVFLKKGPTSMRLPQISPGRGPRVSFIPSG